MLRLTNLSKRYGDRLLFQNLNHTFTPGAVALCEEESTGKSTLLGVIAGVIEPDEGDIWVEGHSLARSKRKAQNRLAYVPANCMTIPELSGRGLLEMVANQKKAALSAEVFDLSESLGLEPHLDKPFEQMSTGTRRKVFLAAAAIGKPAVVLADGPTDGLDARARTALVDWFKLWTRDRVVLFASHDAEFVQACGARALQVATLG